MLTDSHCHLASHRFTAAETPDLIERALAAGVSRLVTLSTCLDDVQANLALATHPAVHACVGIHPCDVHHAPDDAVRRLAAFTDDPRVCAIGETGLDYFHPAPEGWEESAYRERQREFLHQHFELAARAGLNLVIHTRDRSGHASFEDALEIHRGHHHSVRAVFHCFAGSWENARRVLDLGGLVSFGGVLTFKNAREVRDTACHCPQGSFMLETDSPYLAPEPFRGQRNEPAHVRRVAEFLAPLRGESIAQLAAHTTQTANGFFRFRPQGN
jgi:TatD DNase family protein